MEQSGLQKYTAGLLNILKSTQSVCKGQYLQYVVWLSMVHEEGGPCTCSRSVVWLGMVQEEGGPCTCSRSVVWLSMVQEEGGPCTCSRSVVWLSMVQEEGGWGGPAAMSWNVQASFMLPISLLARQDS